VIPWAARQGGRVVGARTSPRLQPACAAVVSALLLFACASPGPLAPVGRAPDRGAGASLTRGAHTVRSGDTLYAIAWRYGLDYRELARWNGIPEPFTIYLGQELRISRPSRIPPPPRLARAPSAPGETQRGVEGRNRAPVAAPSPGTAPSKVAAPSPEVAPSNRRRSGSPAPAPARSEDAPVKAWEWPVRGKVIATFGGPGGKGIDIAGNRGTAVRAAAPGRVVYSGSGLRGYGKLIIVKHNKRYLSAYAHNDRLHVNEGDAVASGQRIAAMGSSDAKRVKLHFEIRRDGKPVDPIRYLPR